MTPRRRTAGAAAVCLLLAIVHTWPLALNPGRYSRNDNGDAQLTEWILAWVEHQLPRHPTQLFEANIFYPAHDALAFSEPLIVPALMGAPLAAAGASPVLVHNVLLIAGFALTAFAGWWLIVEWTGDSIAGLLTGSAFAFNTHTLTRLAHIQGVHIYGLPLVLLHADRLLREPRARDAGLLAFWMTVLAYTSGYLVVFAVVMLAAVFLVRAREWLGRTRAFVPAVTGAAVLALVATLPVYMPYRRVARDQHMLRSLDIVKDYSATLKGYLATAGRIHYETWSKVFFKDPVDAFFPGIVVIALAALAVVRYGRREPPAGKQRLILSLVVLAVVGLVLSLGTGTPVYGWVFHLFPPMQGLRAAARFGNLFLLAMAVLAGLGLAAWRALPSSRGALAPSRGFRLRAEGRTWIAILLLVLVNVEALRAPFEYREFTGIPGIYRLLADEPGRVVLAEQPFFPRWAIFENAPYVLASTAHWRPLMNGYSGYTPDSYQHYADAFWYFPEDWAIKAMKDAGVTHVMVHLQRFGERDAPAVLSKIEARTDMELVAVSPQEGGIRLYRFK